MEEMKSYIYNLTTDQSFLITNICIGIGIFLLAIIIGVINDETLGLGHSDNTKSYLVRYLITLPLISISVFLLGCSAIVITLKNLKGM